MDRVLVHDVSHWQGNLKPYWQMFKDKGCKAVIIKATEGYANWNIFKEHAEQAKEAGFLVGSYHYFRQQIINIQNQWINCDPARQAKNYYDWVQKCGVPMDLPPALDVENGNNPYLSAATITKCLQKIEDYFGRKPMVYSSPSILINQLGTPPWGEYPLWLAHYTTEDKIQVPGAWQDWTLWQFSDKITYNKTDANGNVISRKPIDHNWFNGTLEDLYEFCQKDQQPEQPEEPLPTHVKIIAKKADGTPGFLYFRDSPTFDYKEQLAIGDGEVLQLIEEDEDGLVEAWLNQEGPEAPPGGDIPDIVNPPFVYPLGFRVKIGNTVIFTVEPFWE
jgi:GH25 family lysozyme M1 (1,4-beta-N-acetylmuramidase)